MALEAKVILDSVSPEEIRLTTMEVTYHRMIHSEFMTHRAKSRNSASSRAIPIEKQIKKIKEEIAMPVEFGSNQGGMQAGPPLEGWELHKAKMAWIKAAERAVESAEELLELGVHKQVTNRILEPFMWHTVIVTSVDYQNFFGLRCHPDAQPEIRAIAELMKEAYDLSNPKELGWDDWHTPYIQPDEVSSMFIDEACKISAARCARVSYLTHDGVRDHSADYKLFDRLISAMPRHDSPLEHVATPFYEWGTLSPRGNFIEFREWKDKTGLYAPKGWAQLRHNLDN